MPIIQRFIQISGGKCPIGSDNEYVWQSIGLAYDFEEAKSFIETIDQNYTYRLKYSEGLSILLHEKP